MPDGGFARLWEFAVEPARQAEFERHYGPDGSWARLFREAPGFLGTELLVDRSNPRRYVTIDRWQSPDHWRAFHAQFAAEYEALDRHCAGLTTRESSLGEYSSMSSS